MSPNNYAFWLDQFGKMESNASEFPVLSTFLDVISTDSLPIHGVCDRQREWYVKATFPKVTGVKNPFCVDPPGHSSQFMRRVMINEQLAALLGNAIGAPVPECSVVNVTQEFLTQNASLLDNISVGSPFSPKYYSPKYIPGLSHASLAVNNLGPRENAVRHVYGNNVDRFASLVLLYGWIGFKDDYQFFYLRDTDRDVYSLDHGFCFGGPIWTRESLSNILPAPTLIDQKIKNSHNFIDNDFKPTYDKLKLIQPNDIAAIVKGIPDEWGINLRDRVRMSTYIWKRQQDILLYFNGRFI